VDQANVGMLYETSQNWNNNFGTIGELLNSRGNSNLLPGVAHTTGMMGYEGLSVVTGGSRDGGRNFEFDSNPARFTTHTMIYSCIEDPSGCQVFVDGVKASFVTGGDKGSYSIFENTYAERSFGNQYLYLASRSGDSAGSLYFKGDIAAVRIYGRKLNPDEIAGNALIDQLHYN
jgi:hypothetical protein